MANDYYGLDIEIGRFIFDDCLFYQLYSLKLKDFLFDYHNIIFYEGLLSSYSPFCFCLNTCEEKKFFLYYLDYNKQKNKKKEHTIFSYSEELTIKDKIIQMDYHNILGYPIFGNYALLELERKDDWIIKKRREFLKGLINSCNEYKDIFFHFPSVKFFSFIIENTSYCLFSMPGFELLQKKNILSSYLFQLSIKTTFNTPPTLIP